MPDANALNTKNIVHEPISNDESRILVQIDFLL
jgi:hypothetical protein